MSCKPTCSPTYKLPELPERTENDNVGDILHYTDTRVISACMSLGTKTSHNTDTVSAIMHSVVEHTG